MVGNQINQTEKSKTRYLKHPHLATRQVGGGGGQPARLYGLAKVHKVNTPLRPVLSLRGSSYYNLNKVLAKLFEKIEGANIETNSLDAREI